MIKENKRININILLMIAIIIASFVFFASNIIRADEYNSEDFSGVGFEGWDENTTHYMCTSAINPVNNSKSLIYPLVYKDNNVCTLMNSTEVEAQLKALNYQITTGNASYNSNTTRTNANSLKILFYRIDDSNYDEHYVLMQVSRESNLYSYYMDFSENENQNYDIYWKPSIMTSGRASYQGGQANSMLYDLNDNKVYWLRDYTVSNYYDRGDPSGLDVNLQRFANNVTYINYELSNNQNYVFKYSTNQISDILYIDTYCQYNAQHFAGEEYLSFDTTNNLDMTIMLAYYSSPVHYEVDNVEYFNSRYSNNEVADNSNSRNRIYDFRDLFGFYVYDNSIAQYTNVLPDVVNAFNLKTVNLWSENYTEPDPDDPDNIPIDPDGYLYPDVETNIPQIDFGGQKSIIEILDEMTNNMNTLTARIKNMSVADLENKLDELQTGVNDYMSAFDTNEFRGASTPFVIVKPSYASLIDKTIDNVPIIKTLYYMACGVSVVVMLII